MNSAQFIKFKQEIPSLIISDEPSSSQQPELSYKTSKAYGYWCNTELVNLVIQHHIISPKTSSAISCILNETQWKLASNAFRKSSARKTGSKQGSQPTDILLHFQSPAAKPLKVMEAALHHQQMEIWNDVLYITDKELQHIVQMWP